MSKKLGFIGCGNMGKGMIHGVLEEVIAEIKDTVSDDEIIVSIAPGKSLSWFDEMFGKSLKVIRTMPNTPAMVGEGMMGVCANERVSQEELDTVLDLCSGFSKAEMIDERQCLEAQKWFSRQESIRASSRIWCAHLPEPLSRLCVCLRKRA